MMVQREIHLLKLTEKIKINKIGKTEIQYNNLDAYFQII